MRERECDGARERRKKKKNPRASKEKKEELLAQFSLEFVESALSSLNFKVRVGFFIYNGIV